MIKQFKSFYNKDKFDYSSGYVDPFEFHQTFYFFLKAFKVADIKRKSNFIDQNKILFVIQMIYLILLSISFYHGAIKFDLPHMTETGVYIILQYYILTMLCCTKFNVPQFLNLLTAMKEDFQYVCDVKDEYRKKYFENQVSTWKISITISFFLFGIAIALIGSNSLVLLYFLASHKSEDGGKRPFLFPLWLPNMDIHKSPAYEILFVFVATVVFTFAYIYIFMIQTQIVWVRQITSKVDIITWGIQDLLIDVHPTRIAEEKKYFAKILKMRLREIVIQHQSMYRLLDDFSQVYKKLLLMEQVICGPIMCLTGFCSVLKFEEGEVHMLFIIIFVAGFVVFFIPSYLGTFLLSKIVSICDACWDIPFWNADPLIRPYIVLIMQRTLRPLPLQAPGFEEISIQTFSRKMASAYSCFNMLRQVNV